MARLKDNSTLETGNYYCAGWRDGSTVIVALGSAMEGPSDGGNFNDGGNTDAYVRCFPSIGVYCVAYIRPNASQPYNGRIDRC